MSFYDNLVALCSKNGMKITPTVISCGGTTGSISGWKRGIWPNSEIVVALAAHLGVSTDALLLGKDSNRRIFLGDDTLDFATRLKKLMKEQNVSNTTLYMAISVTSSMVTGWTTGKTKPSMDNVAKLAKFFNVSADYIIGLENQSSQCFELSKIDQRLLSAFHSLPIEKRWEEIGRIECLSEETSEKTTR